MVERKPEWLKVPVAGGGGAHARVRARLRQDHLHTVCDEARCPNRAECWNDGTAALLLLGDTCTRGCRFCAVNTGDPGGRVEAAEPERTAQTVVALELDYVVLTSVDRDDLPDGGASVYAATARAVKKARPDTLIEALIPDFQGRRETLATVVAAGIDVIAHNLEVVRRLTPRVRDRRASYDLSLEVLRTIHELDPARVTKSSLMLGLGEDDDEVRQAMRDLRAVHVDVLTLGQYLRPTQRQLPVARYVTPETFAQLQEEARALGFRAVVAGPLVRSSHRAREVFAEVHAERGPTLEGTGGEIERGTSGWVVRQRIHGLPTVRDAGDARREPQGP